MFARLEVALKPELTDPISSPLLRRMEMTDPHLRKLVRWARAIDVFWLDVPLAREEMIYAASEVLWDPVLHWLFTGNLIPSAAGKKGGIEDLLETAPNRPGRFFVIEKRYRLGVTDHAARTLVESLDAVLKRKMTDYRVCSGSMLILEGPHLTEEHLAGIAREYFANELLESWTLITEKEILNSERFHPERVKREMPKAPVPRFHTPIEWLPIASLSPGEIRSFAKKRGISLTLAETETIQTRFSQVENRDMSDAELEVLSKIWSTSRAEKLLNSGFEYRSASEDFDHANTPIPPEVLNLKDSTFLQVNREVPRSWLISGPDSKGAGIVSFDEEDGIAFDAQIEARSVASDAFHGSMTGASEATLRSACAGHGAKPILMTDVIFTSDLNSMKPGVSDHLNPRRILDGVKQGISAGGSYLGVPVVGGALEVDSNEGITPVIHFSALSILPKVTHGILAESREAHAGDLLALLGSKTGKDGIVGSPGVQIADTTLEKRLLDFLVECRELGLTRLFVPCGEAGLSGALYSVGVEFGGVEADLDQVDLKQPGLRALEILGSESLERLIAVIPAEKRPQVQWLAERRGILIRWVGEIQKTGRLRVRSERETIVDLDLGFLKNGATVGKREAVWGGPKPVRNREYGDFSKEGVEVLLRLLSHPNACSREWLIRNMDHEVQGTTALKPLQFVSAGPDTIHVGPNDGAALKPKAPLNVALVVATGIQSRLLNVDPYRMGEMAVDEAVRNALSLGADYGKESDLFALNYQISFRDQDLEDPALNGILVRSCFGASRAAKELQVPIVSGVERTTSGTQSRFHFVAQATAKVGKLGGIKSGEFKSPGDVIYLLGPAQFGAVGSLLSEVMGQPSDAASAEPDWDSARRLYSWLGGFMGKEQKKLRSIHDISDGGLLVSVSECLLSRGFGALISFPDGLSRTMEWEFLLGEGFHNFIVTIPELDIPVLEAELSQLQVPFAKLGVVTASGVLQVKKNDNPILVIETKVIRQAWKKEGYWE